MSNICEAAERLGLPYSSPYLDSIGTNFRLSRIGLIWARRYIVGQLILLDLVVIVASPIVVEQRLVMLCQYK